MASFVINRPPMALRSNLSGSPAVIIETNPAKTISVFQTGPEYAALFLPRHFALDSVANFYYHIYFTVSQAYQSLVISDTLPSGIFVGFNPDSNADITLFQNGVQVPVDFIQTDNTFAFTMPVVDAGTQFEIRIGVNALLAELPAGSGAANTSSANLDGVVTASNSVNVYGTLPAGQGRIGLRTLDLSRNFVDLITDRPEEDFYIELDVLLPGVPEAIQTIVWDVSLFQTTIGGGMDVSLIPVLENGMPIPVVLVDGVEQTVGATEFLFENTIRFSLAGDTALAGTRLTVRYLLRASLPNGGLLGGYFSELSFNESLQKFVFGAAYGCEGPPVPLFMGKGYTACMGETGEFISELPEGDNPFFIALTFSTYFQPTGNRITETLSPYLEPLLYDNGRPRIMLFVGGNERTSAAVVDSSWAQETREIGVDLGFQDPDLGKIAILYIQVRLTEGVPFPPNGIFNRVTYQIGKLETIETNAVLKPPCPFACTCPKRKKCNRGIRRLPLIDCDS